MENSAQRRLESIARHLLLPQIPTRNLRRNPLSAAEPSPVIIGGMVLDIHASPYAHPSPGTTTPGKVQYVSGGVARNVAECMSKLGSKPFMISVVGQDMAGDLLLRYWKSAGLSTEGILQLPGATTPVVSNVFDCSGELAAAVASVEAVETYLNPEWICRFQHNICTAPVLMVDANLSPQSLQISCQVAARSGIPVWFEPVSVTKSTRIASVIDYKGIKLLLVTLGSDGVFLCCREGLSFMKDHLKRTTTGFTRQLHELLKEACPIEQCISSIETGQKSFRSCAFHFPALPASVVSLTGAGDCLVGGILASVAAGLDVMQSVAVGIAVAKAAVEAETNVPTKFCSTNVADDAKRILSAAQPLWLE
ncbi:pseudouridine kinase isoform X2 [Typha latifolia]|uniref:pseudouridine kinase isoform X2 n=1 Tax=Typha latifolia TaxID=4733 RepID=UPI003C2EA0F3